MLFWSTIPSIAFFLCYVVATKILDLLSLSNIHTIHSILQFYNIIERKSSLILNGVV